MLKLALSSLKIEKKVFAAKILAMKSITVPIREAEDRLRELVEEVKHGAKVTITSNGHAEAILSPAPTLSAPWRVDKPDDPARYGDLQPPVMEDWK